MASENKCGFASGWILESLAENREIEKRLESGMVATQRPAKWMACLGNTGRNGSGWWMALVECLPDVGGMAEGEIEWNGVSLAWDLPFCRHWGSEREHRNDGFS